MLLLFVDKSDLSVSLQPPVVASVLPPAKLDGFVTLSILLCRCEHSTAALALVVGFVCIRTHTVSAWSMKGYVRQVGKHVTCRQWTRPSLGRNLRDH